MSTTTTAIRITPPTALGTAMVMMRLVSLGDPVVLLAAGVVPGVVPGVVAGVAGVVVLEGVGQY